MSLQEEIEQVDNRIEIRLTEIDNQSVGLKSLSVEALQSFILVVSSLKAIAENVVDKEHLTFSIEEGSAACCVEAPADSLARIYSEIDSAIVGDSSNKEVTDGLRIIQNEIKRTGTLYEFRYLQPTLVIDMHGRLNSAKRIAVKRTRRADFKYELLLGQGVIKLIGGENPNYHIDYGNGDKKTIDCSESDAGLVKEFLYEVCNPLVLCKVYTNPEKKNVYSHLAMVESDLADAIGRFVDGYNSHEDILDRLDHTHDFVDSVFENTDSGHRILRTLLIGFKDERFQLSEIKTLLVISKPFLEHEIIREPRQDLLDLYNAIRR
jgi:hypothetical protein